MYFLRNTNTIIAVPNDLPEADRMMSDYVETGLLNGQALLMLEQLISQVRHTELWNVL